MQHDNGLEVKVGVFVIVALLVIASLMIVFGRFGEHWAATYTITVTFPNADGLIKGAEVNLAGAPVGRVSSPPVPMEEGDGVAVHLKIRQSARIREGARFRIAEVGLLGDRNVEIDPSPNRNAALLHDGDTIEGGTTPGFSSLTDAAQPILDHLDQITAKINKEVLTPETETDLRESIKKLRSVLTRTDALLADAQAGRGALGRMLKDPKMADDLSDFIYNLRQKGVLFYSDVAAKQEAEHNKERSNR